MLIHVRALSSILQMELIHKGLNLLMQMKINE